MIQTEARGMLTTIPTAGEHAAPEAEELKKAAEELPIVRIVDTLVKHAILEEASDIHIEPLEKEVVVRYRIDGILHDAMTLPINVRDGIVARLKVLSSLKPAVSKLKRKISSTRFVFQCFLCLMEKK